MNMLIRFVMPEAFTAMVNVTVAVAVFPAISIAETLRDWVPASRV
jgi:hypothetical protein